MRRPSIAYDAVVLNSALESAFNWNWFYRVQGSTCRMICGAFHATPFAGLKSTLALPRLRLLIQVEAIISSFLLGYLVITL